MNTLKGWFLGLIGGIGLMGMFINFPLWSNNSFALWLAITLSLVSGLVGVYCINKEEKTN